MASDYQKLRIARDLAAYRALGHIDAAICRQGDAELALSILLNARATYEAADKKLQDAGRNTHLQRRRGYAALTTSEETDARG